MFDFLHLGSVLKWLLVILVLFFIPKGSIFIVIVFSILHLVSRLSSLDLVLAFFLIYFVQNGLADLGNLFIFRYLLIAVVLVKSLFDYGLSTIKFLLESKIAIALIFYLFFHSIFFSVNSFYSLRELILFLLFLWVVNIGVYTKKSQTLIYLKKNLLSMYIVILLLSILTLLTPEIAYARNGFGFQGISVHPNAFGIFIAPFSAYFLIRFLIEKNFLTMFIFAISFSLLFMSASRTSLLSLILGLVIYISFNKTVRVVFFSSISLLLLPISLIILLNLSTFTFLFNSFFVKGNYENTFSESIETSRGPIIEAQMKNINQFPFFGIGFKIPSNKEALIRSSADEDYSYEKGNSLLASLEELGVIGTILLFIFILTHVLPSTTNLSSFEIVPIVAVFSSLGEATLFSVGGMGILVWTLILVKKFNQMESQD